MTVDAGQVADVEGTLVSGGLVLVAGLLVLAAAAPARFARLRAALAGTGAAWAAVVAVLATAGSLWFSEGAHFPPCELCWFQRVAMYPLAVLLPVAALRGDGGVRFHATVLAGLGLAVSAWHNLVETFPDRELGACDPAAPCTVRWVEGVGFWTIPRMAAACFVLVLVALRLDPGRPQEAP